MKNKFSKKQLQVFIFICIAIISLGIGYAAISSIILTINGTGTVSVNSNNFNVHFDETVNPTITQDMGSATIDAQDNKVAHISVTGLSKVGDSALAEYTVINESNGIGVEFGLELTNTNTEYFRVTESIVKKQLQAGQSTKVRVLVELTKTPLENTVTTNITGTITSNAIDNAGATSTAGISVQSPTAFESDSWSTIKTNIQNGNTDQYNVGDTKTVKINNNDFTVRIANKSVSQNCGSEGYSETACGFVVEFAEIVEKRVMNSTRTNVGGWPATEMRTYLNGTFYNSLPSDLQAAIKPTRVISGHGSNDSTNFTSTDNLYLLSGVEVFGSDDYDTAAGTTHQLEFYQGMEGTKVQSPWLHTAYTRTYKGYNGSDGSTEYWWLRPAISNDYYDVRRVGYGVLIYDFANSASGGLAPAFRIG